MIVRRHGTAAASMKENNAMNVSTYPIDNLDITPEVASMESPVSFDISGSSACGCSVGVKGRKLPSGTVCISPVPDWLWRIDMVMSTFRYRKIQGQEYKREVFRWE